MKKLLLLAVSLLLASASVKARNTEWYTQGRFNPTKRIEIKISNPTDEYRENTPVIISRKNFPMPDFHEMSITIVDPELDPRPAPSDSVLLIQGGHQLREEFNGRMLYHQADDLDKDGIWDEIFFQVNLEPREQRTIYIYMGENTQGWNKHRTHANIASYCRHIMPFWETEEVGWKIWFANSVDAYGKRKPGFVSPTLYTENIDGYGIARINADYGSDIQSVASSFGASAICLFEHAQDITNISMPRKTPVQKELAPKSLWNAGQISDTRYAYDVVANGPIRSIIKIKGMNWDSGSGFYEYEQYYTAYAHHNYCISKVVYTTFEPHNADVLGGCGMAKKMNENNFVQKNGYVISSGYEEIADPEKIDDREKMIVDFIGGAIVVKECYNPEYRFIEQYTGNHTFAVEMDDNNSYEYMVCTAWSEGTKLKTKEAFNEYVDKMSIEFNNPVEYEFITIEDKE